MRGRGSAKGREGGHHFSLTSWLTNVSSAERREALAEGEGKRFRKGGGREAQGLRGREGGLEYSNWTGMKISCLPN